jgi:hypothetical protein
MGVLTEIAFELDAPTLAERAHVPPDSADRGLFECLVDMARDVGKPKAFYRECFIESKGEETVAVDGIRFTSRTLRRNLDKVERVFPFVATCGHELDQVKLPTGDLLETFWWDMIKQNVLVSARNHLSDHLTRRYALGKTATMSPGSGDVNVWPIEQQRNLFKLLGNVEELIGVQLTDSFLMVPNKTVSGVRFPTEVDFRSCQVCHRENCPSRSAPFDQKLWESIQHGCEA